MDDKSQKSLYRERKKSMSTILEMLHNYTAENPNVPILFDDAHSKGITYTQFDEMTGKVCAWLREQGIGKEDFVLINLPRGVFPVIAMVGVWKAGAAWALVEDTYAPDRIDYIRRDCRCVAELNKDNWENVMHMKPFVGFVTADDHDAAYAIYTSGTTGNPKGVLHEYGNLERAIESIRLNGETPFYSKDRLALLAPMNFVASVIVILRVLSIPCSRMYVVPYTVIKNPVKLMRFFLEKRITITFLTPSYVRKIGNKTGPFLRMLFVGSEPANNIYNQNVQLVNVYAASESGFAVGIFEIDKPYETCPIGKPEVSTQIRLIDEDGKEVPDGETGELCFENPYVRGYLNLPQETERAFRDGFYHTGDLARRNPDGSYVLLGRSGDMIKINGNRIEPAEIEAAVTQALGIKWAAARGFNDNEKSFLCAYYKEEVEFDPEQLRNELMKRLPYYMIPAYFIKVDEIPLKANGKMDRMALPKPDISDFRSDYAAPTNDTEEKLCRAFEKVLKIDRAGIHDDFYEMGGDSLSSIELIVESGLPGLNASEVFRGRTPEKIALLYEELHAGYDGEDPDQENARAMQSAHPLTAEQLYMVDYQLYTPNSTMYNLYTMMKLDLESYDMESMAMVMQSVIRNHPALLTTYFWNEDGELAQQYSPDNLQEIHVEKLSEFEFRYVKDTLVYPFKIVGGRLYRCRIFETEKAGYVFFDVHHSVFDGTSLKILMENVGKIAAGMQPEPDYYYLMLQNREDLSASAFYDESRQYFEDRYKGVEWTWHPRFDHETRKNEMGELVAEIDLLRPQMAAVERSYKITGNEFFITVAAIAVSIYTNKNDIMLSWIYNGREDMQNLSTIGLLFRDLPVGVRLRDDETLRDLFADVHDQVQKGIEHSCYPYVERNGLNLNQESVYLLYQQDIRDMDNYGIETIDIRQNQAASQSVLDIEILDSPDGFEMMIDYFASLYDDESIERFKDIYIRTAQSLATHNSQSDVTIRELKEKIADKKNFFQYIAGIFSRKR